MLLSQLLNFGYITTTDIVNKSLLIREINEFNMYYSLSRCDNVYNTIVY